MRIEHKKQDEREAEFNRLNDIDAKKRSRRSVAMGDASPGAPRKASTSSKPRRTKAQVFRENMTANGFDAAWIDAQIKKLGLE